MLLGPVYYDIVYLLAHKRLLLKTEQAALAMRFEVVFALTTNCQSSACATQFAHRPLMLASTEDIRDSLTKMHLGTRTYR